MDHSTMADNSLWTMAVIHFFTMIIAMIVYDVVKSWFKKGGH